jgi:hypothetical protein
MWTRLLTWLRRTAPEAPVEQQVEQYMSGLRSPDLSVRLRTSNVLARILADDAGYAPGLRVALLEALAEQSDSEALDLVSRYVRLLANSGFPFGRQSPVQAAAQRCLDRWQAKDAERVQADVLLRAVDRPIHSDTLLRPAAEASATEPEELLRGSTLAKEE